MYYTERLQGAESYYACAGNNFKELFQHIPAGSDTPLPPNPALDELAAGHAHKGMDWSRAGKHSLDASFRGYERPSYGRGYIPPSSYQQRFLDGLDYQNPYSYDSDYTDAFYDQVINQRSRNRHPEDEEEEYVRRPEGYYPPRPRFDDPRVRGQDWRSESRDQQLEQTDSNYRNAGRGMETDGAENISPDQANQAIHKPKQGAPSKSKPVVKSKTIESLLL